MSNANRVFFGQEHTVAVITTRAQESAIGLAEETLTEDRLKEYPSYVNPRWLHVFRHGDIERRIAQVDRRTLAGVADSVYEYARASAGVDP